MFLNTARKYIYPDGFVIWAAHLITGTVRWSGSYFPLLPSETTANKRRIVDLAEPVRPLVPVHLVSMEPDLDCLPNLPGALDALPVQNLRLFPVDHVIIYDHVMRDRALVEVWESHLEIIKRGSVQQLIDHLNTVEIHAWKESDGSIPFLDTLIVRKDDGSLKVLVYRKKDSYWQVLILSITSPSTS